jgi:Fe-S cluster assembly protein SufD
MPEPVNNLPTPRDENWRYANLRPLARARAEAVPEGAVATDSSPAAAAILPAPIPGHERWVFIDGHHEPSLSNAADPRAVLLDAARAGEAFAAMLDSELVDAGVDFSLARANARRGGQVLHIELPAGGDAAAIELVFVASAPASQGTSYPRVQVHAQRNTRLSLVERHLSAGDADSAVNSAVDIAIGAGATVNHVRVQDCTARAGIFDTLVANVGDNAQYRLRTVTLGGLASRSTAFIKLAGRAARCEFVAASIANGIQSHDIFAEIDHAAPQATTREIFRGIANDRGKLAFNGKMIVRATAHDADSDQSLKSLLTGNGAEAAARPQLEIYTDRVRAKHGATTGKLDEQMLFYLLSRGIDRPAAQALLQWAFIEDVVSQIESVELRRDVERRASEQLREVASLDGLLGVPS